MGGLRIEVQHLCRKVLHMGTQYRQLTESNRTLIESLMLLGISQRSIAKTLQVSPSTISRELRRGCPPGSDRYVAGVGQWVRAQRRQQAGQARRKLGADTSSLAWRTVLSGFAQGWSPQQIAGRLKTVNVLATPSKPALPYVSHETIYCAIYAQPRGTLRTELVKSLRRSRAGRLPRARGTSRSPNLLDMTSIHLRPPEVAARVVPGHWEGDLIKGARNASAVGTIVERTSRYVMLVKLDGMTSGAILDAFTRRLRRIPSSLRKTLTYDQGSEMACHAELAKRLKIDIFFCDPRSPWQRGTNENANGLIREYLPKGTDLRHITEDQLAEIENLLNGRPRKVLGFRTPAEVFAELKVGDNRGVALQA